MSVYSAAFQVASCVDLNEKKTVKRNCDLVSYRNQLGWNFLTKFAATPAMTLLVDKKRRAV